MSKATKSESRVAATEKSANPAREKNIDLALSSITKQFGEGSIMRLGSNAKMKVETLSTGSLAIDLMLGVGGLLFMVQSDVALDGSGAGAVPITNRLRVAQSSGAAVTWDRPTALFRLMWRQDVACDPLAQPIEANHPAMAALRRGIDALLPDAAGLAERRAAALAAWALVHGLSMLALDGQINLADSEIDAVVAGHFDRQMRG